MTRGTTAWVLGGTIMVLSGSLLALSAAFHAGQAHHPQSKHACAHLHRVRPKLHFCLLPVATRNLSEKKGGVRTFQTLAQNTKTYSRQARHY